jgi:transcriptional antiterminator RfaH
VNRWYVVRTKVGRETLAEEQLQRQAYPTYCPRLLAQCRRFGRRVRLITPLFPQYLFLQLNIGVQDLAPAKSTPGVLGLVRFGEEYAVMPQRIIDGLKAREHQGVRPAENPLKPQSHVRITGGPFFGLEGIFLNECAKDRVMVLLNLLGREQAVKIPEQLIELCH